MTLIIYFVLGLLATVRYYIDFLKSNQRTPLGWLSLIKGTIAYLSVLLFWPVVATVEAMFYLMVDED